MKPSLFKYSVLTVGIVAAMGVAGTANAAKLINESSPSIDNIATATYSIGNVAQAPVKSNTVTVNITQSAAFSLTANNEDGDTADDFNTKRTVTPMGRVAFNHTLTNSGNVEDTYTLSLAQGGTIPDSNQDASSYDLATTNVTYTIFNADNSQKSTKTVTGTVFQETAILLKPNERADILISAKTTGNVGGNSQNLTLSAASTFFTNKDPAKATLTNIDNSITKVPVFKITSSANKSLNLNDPNSTVTYTIKILNDSSANYSADAQDIVVFDGLPAGLRLADARNLSVSNNASITAGNLGKGNGSAADSITVTALDLAVGEEATITFDVQRDTAEADAIVKGIVNHATVKLNLGADSGTVYDTTDVSDTNQNTEDYYPAADDSEVINGTANDSTGGDSAAPLTANQRAIHIEEPSNKEIPTSTSDTTQVLHSAVILNTGQEIEGDQPGEIKFKITPTANSKVTVVTGSVELVYDDNDPSTPNATYTILRDSNGDNDLSKAVSKSSAPAWTGMKPGSTVTINYKVESTNAVMGTSEKVLLTLILGGNDTPTTGNRTVTNTTIVKGLVLNKQQALNKGCLATATLSFDSNPISAEPNDCIVYKITAFNNFSTADVRFSFNDIKISDATSQFKNKAQILSSATTPAFAIKLDNVTNESAEPNTNEYNAADNTTEVSGTVTSLAPQKYAAMMFAVKINPDGAETTPTP